mgnify:CR=1 FL=1
MRPRSGPAPRLPDPVHGLNREGPVLEQGDEVVAAASGDDGESDIQHMNNVRSELLGYNYTSVDQIYDPGATDAEVAAALNAGRGVLNVPITDTFAMRGSFMFEQRDGWIVQEKDEFDLQFADIFEQINAFAAGAPIHMINPEVWGQRS